MSGEVTPTGAGFEVEAGLIGASFRLDPAEVPGLMRAGAITSRCETGVGEDAGRWRLTFFHKGRALRLTVDGTGAILRRATFDVPRRRSASPAEPSATFPARSDAPSERRPE